jgi:hypothetical protein
VNFFIISCGFVSLSLVLGPLCFEFHKRTFCRFVVFASLLSYLLFKDGSQGGGGAVNVIKEMPSV